MENVKRWVVWLLLGLICAGCAPTRYASFRPPGATDAWTIKADMAMTGWTTVSINGDEVVRGQFPALYGSQEFDADYRGHKVKMALTKELISSKESLGDHCVVMIDGDVAGRFEW